MRRISVGCIVAVVVVAAGTITAERANSAREPAMSSSSSSTADSTTTVASTSTTSPTTTSTTLNALQDRVAATLTVVAHRDGEVSFSLVDASGLRVDQPSSQRVGRAASIIKVAIAVVLLRHHPSPSGERLIRLTDMIERSDNDAATALYDDIGGRHALQALFDELGMNDTAASSAWGFTTTTAADLATLFTAVADGDALDASQTNLLLALMSNVTTSQAWGIKDALPDDVPVALKNGWFPDTDAPVWRVNCGAIIGEPSSRVVLTVTSRYPQKRGLAYGQETCRLVAAALLPSLVGG